MKIKKVILSLLVILFITFSFLIGMLVGKIKYYQDEYDKTCEVMANISNWNTDGEELSVITKNGFEFYAYKEEIK